MEIGKVVIKIGSRLLANEDLGLNLRLINEVCAQVAQLKRAGKQVIIVSSGAVASGRSVETLRGDFPVSSGSQNPHLLREQILAAVGQPKLMRAYNHEFEKYGITMAQLLVTRADFADRSRYLSLRTVVDNMLLLGIVPIFNENDSLSIEELDFSDNDQLSCMVAAMIEAHLLIIMTDVPGVLNDQKKIIAHVSDVDDVRHYVGIQDSASSVVTKGGMQSKLDAADLITSLGIDMRIISGHELNGIVRVAADGEHIGTYFPANGKKLSKRKAWIGAGAVERGQIVVSTFLADLLRKRHVASILLRGVEKVDKRQTFKQGDVIRVCDIDGTVLGKGEARMSADDLRQAVKESHARDAGAERTSGGEKIVIHYDYFVFI